MKKTGHTQRLRIFRYLSRFSSPQLPLRRVTFRKPWKKNWVLVLSVALNILFLSVGVFSLPQKGVSSYLISQSPSQSREPVKFSPYYLDRTSLFEVLPRSQNEIIFVGDSLTNRGEWSELFENPNIKNRGINGDNTYGLLKRLDQLTASRPSKIFIMLGINDLISRENLEQITYKYRLILKTIKQLIPSTQVFVQSVLPVNNRTKFILDNNDVIAFNNKLKGLANEFKYEYVDLYSAFAIDNQLPEQYTNDGIHLNGTGYLVWKQVISKYIELMGIPNTDLPSKP
jgi:lysophospholipase L1-like esterase